MHPPFFVPARRAEPVHSRPPKGRGTVKRTRPERLEFETSLAQMAAQDLPVARQPSARALKMRRHIGLWLIRLGKALAEPRVIGSTQRR